MVCYVQVKKKKKKSGSENEMNKTSSWEKIINETTLKLPQKLKKLAGDKRTVI